MFQQSSMDVFSLYKQSLKSVEVAYLQGKEDAFEEILKYLVGHSKLADLRYLPVNDFVSYVQERYQSHRTQCEKLKRPTPLSGGYAMEERARENPYVHVESAIRELAEAGELLAHHEQADSLVHQKLLTANFKVLKVQESKKRKRQVVPSEKQQKQLLPNYCEEESDHPPARPPTAPQFRFNFQSA